MFGGWGPHLGHLVRASRPDGSGTDLYWVDDLCSQQVPGDCDVLHNRRIGIFRREPSGWRKLATLPLPPGVQQNTATLADGDMLRTYGIQVGAEPRVVECAYSLRTGRGSCTTLPVTIGPSANYVGAARSPTGARLVHWTHVMDGGGGSFSYIVHSGNGWSGPRTGGIGGYNDCAYVHVAFEVGSSRLTLFGQVVSGTAPNWSYGTLVGQADLATATPVQWANRLRSPEGDAIISTNDLLIDDVTGDAHLLARTARGAAVYFVRPRPEQPGQPWSGPLFVEPASFRARLLATPQELLLVYGPDAGGLQVRAMPRAALRPGQPVPWASLPPRPLPLPSGFGRVLGIYPVSTVYQSVPTPALELAVVGSARQNEVVFIGPRG